MPRGGWGADAAQVYHQTGREGGAEKNQENEKTAGSVGAQQGAQIAWDSILLRED
jgi:hypothetical protein